MEAQLSQGDPKAEELQQEHHPQQMFANDQSNKETKPPTLLGLAQQQALAFKTASSFCSFMT